MTEERATILFNSQDSLLKICVGSWKAYNECNDHALGSYYKGHFYIDFMSLEDAEELHDLLSFIGWTEEEQDELFIQDYESELFRFHNCDYISPASIIEAIAGRQDEVAENAAKIAAMIEYDSYYEDIDKALEDLDDFDFYEDMSGEEYEEMLFYDCMDKATADLLDRNPYITIDFEAMARDDDITETERGVLVRY
ncbi:MAG: antirestriction protein ArdA [Methanobrevibacter sp.]|nr:antirestriction protein ArdA [Methanobrevibacter sp.]